MLSIMDSFIEFLNTNFFGMSFGLIISVILFLLDRQEKRRQEETLRRQDESLDIILDQVSKVNAFQTRSLSLAIESLGKDFENFKTDIDIIKTSLNSSEFSSENVKPFSNEQSEKVIPDQSNQPIIPTLSAKFGQILSNQIDTFIGQIRSNISDLAKTDYEKDKNLYKVKKSLEFDIKDLFNIQSMLNDLKNEKASIKTAFDNSISPDEPNTGKQELDKNNSKVPEDDNLAQESSDNISNQLKLDDIDGQLKKLTTIPEIIKFTESFINKFETLNDEEKLSKTRKFSLSDKKKVTPNTTISSKEVKDEINRD